MCRCPSCNPYNISKPQFEIELLLKENGCVDIEQNKKNIITPLELDLFIPSKNLAIEYNGLAFHSFGKSKWTMLNNFEDEPFRKHHLLFKLKKCREKNISLLNIFENEWLDDTRREIWKSVILNKIGKSPNRIYARDCEIRNITDKELVRSFLKNNHLQGECNGSINVGLFFNDELVQLIVLAKPRFNKAIDMEILRISSKLYYNIVGGISKLFNYIENNYSSINSIISYSNNRYGEGGIYEYLGFKFKGETTPNYWYFKENTFLLFSRLNFQKHKLKESKNYSDQKTEKEIMVEDGFDVIYDCGNKVFVWNREDKSK